jgi:hypothetical protein
VTLDLLKSRAGRFVVLALLLAGGAGASVAVWTAARRVQSAQEAELDVAARIDRLLASVADLTTALSTYVAPGQSREHAYERVTTLVGQIDAGAAALGSLARSSTAGERLRVVSAGMRTVARIEADARSFLEIGSELEAAHLIFTSGRQATTTVTTTFGQLRVEETRAFEVERDALLQQSWTVVGVLGLVWVAGLVALARLPAAEAAPEAPLPPAGTPDAPAEPGGVPAVDLAAAAQVCTAISRATSREALAQLLERAASILDAPGMIVWMGVGDELHAALGVGYSARMIARLGPIKLGADNATAAAWRTRDVHTVPGDMVASGAIVCPMFGPDRCVGVLAAEVRHGREQDPATRAVAVMIAAQLATVVGPWPAAGRDERKLAGGPG